MVNSGNVNLRLVYRYKGTNCSELTIQEREGNYFELMNDYGEVMFSGLRGFGSVGKFVKELSEGKYAN